MAWSLQTIRIIITQIHRDLTDGSKSERIIMKTVTDHFSKVNKLLQFLTGCGGRKPIAVPLTDSAYNRQPGQSGQPVWIGGTSVCPDRKSVR